MKAAIFSTLFCHQLASKLQLNFMPACLVLLLRMFNLIFFFNEKPHFKMCVQALIDGAF